MTRRKQGQRVLWEEHDRRRVRALGEAWMTQADRLLEDDELIDRMYEAQGERHEHSALANACRDGAATAIAETRPQLELRHAGAGGTDESGLPR
jgi:hypothetical protein